MVLEVEKSQMGSHCTLVCHPERYTALLAQGSLRARRISLCDCAYIWLPALISCPLNEIPCVRGPLSSPRTLLDDTCSWRLTPVCLQNQMQARICHASLSGSHAGSRNSWISSR
jgi:hypothetical protein